MSQEIGKKLTMATDAAAPSAAGDGMDLSSFDSARFPSKLRVKVKFTATGAVSGKAYLWGYDGTDWGPVGDAGGVLNEDAAIAGTDAAVYFKVLDDLGVFERLYVQHASLTGTGAAGSAEVAHVVEQVGE